MSRGKSTKKDTDSLKDFRATWIEISLSTLTENYKIIRDAAHKKPIMAIVKADAYGHGAVEVSACLQKEGVEWFGVAIPEEGIQLRKAGIKKPILVLSGFSPNQIDLIKSGNLTPAVYTSNILRLIDKLGVKLNKVIPIHLKIDTGMGRLGVSFSQLKSLIPQIKKMKCIKVEGLFSNLACADDITNPATEKQIRLFNDFAELLKKAGINPPLLHIANSSGILAHPGSLLTLVRPGLSLYGLKPSPELPGKIKPVLSFYSRIYQIKELPAGFPVGYGATFRTPKAMRIGILPVGYADGFPRALSNKGYVLINGSICHIVGRVSMDLIAVSLDRAPEAKLYDTAVLIGKQENNQITPWNIALWSHTIPYEITCNLGKRCPRYYIGKPSHISPPIVLKP